MEYGVMVAQQNLGLFVWVQIPFLQQIKKKHYDTRTSF